MTNPAEIARSIPVTGDRSLVTILRAVATALEAHGASVLSRPCAIDGKQTGTTYGGMICLSLRHLEPERDTWPPLRSEAEVEPVDDRPPTIQQDPEPSYPRPVEAQELADLAERLDNDPRDDARMSWDGRQWAKYFGMPDDYEVDADLVVRLRKMLDKLVNGTADNGDWRKLVAKVCAITVGLVTTKGTPLKWPCRGWNRDKLEIETKAKLDQINRERREAARPPQPKREPEQLVDSAAKILQQNPDDWPTNGLDW
ncbi:MAG: hypothetical protein JSV86_05590 [Gemmatimonadota bacterium]|nr:MAG: hypothetical protein JSV86_05590 [Gemmatimonadota bacterium]